MKFLLTLILLSSSYANAMHKEQVNSSNIRSYQGLGLLRSIAGLCSNQLSAITSMLSGTRSPVETSNPTTFFNLLPIDLNEMVMNYYYSDIIKKMKETLAEEERTSLRYTFHSGHLKFSSKSAIFKSEMLEILSTFKALQFRNSPFTVDSISFPTQLLDKNSVGFFPALEKELPINFFKTIIDDFPNLKSLTLTFQNDSLMKSVKFNLLSQLFENHPKPVKLHIIFEEDSFEQMKSFIETADAGIFKRLDGLTLSYAAPRLKKSTKHLAERSQINERLLQLIEEGHFPLLTEFHLSRLENSVWFSFLKAANKNKFSHLKVLSLGPKFCTQLSVMPLSFLQDFITLVKNEKLKNLQILEINHKCSEIPVNQFQELFNPKTINSMPSLTSFKIEYFDTDLNIIKSQISSYTGKKQYLNLEDFLFNQIPHSHFELVLFKGTSTNTQLIHHR